MKHQLLKVALLCLLGMAIFQKPSPAEACSAGSPPTIESIITRSEIIVRAIVAETDSEGINARIKVIEYLAGDAGAAMLTFSQVSPTQLRASKEGYYYNGPCPLNIAGLSTDGTEYIFFLVRQMDGTYRPSGKFISFANDTSTVEIFTEPEVEAVEITQTKLLNLIQNITGDTPRPPLSDTSEPLTAPLLILTNKNTAYMLPVDSEQPILLAEHVNQISAGGYQIGILTNDEITFINRQSWEKESHVIGNCLYTDCFAFSDNKLLVTLQKNENKIVVCDTWVQDILDCEYGVEFEGQGFLISPMSEAIALWNNNSIEIHQLTSSSFRQSEFDLQLIASTSISPTGEFSAAWSPYGRWLVYSDAKGLWLWDIYYQTPELIIPTLDDGTIPLVRRFSPLGNYIAVSEGDNHYTYDITTGEYFPDGLISPNDRVILAYDTVNNDLSHFQICYLLPFRCLESYFDGDTRLQVEWVGEFEFYMLACLENSCIVTPVQVSTSDYCCYFSDILDSGANLPEISQFDYEPISQIFVAQTGSYTFSIAGKIIDLNGKIDREIVKVQWLPSVFYSSN